MQIANIDVSTDSSQNVINFATLKIILYANIGFCVQTTTQAEQR